MVSAHFLCYLRIKTSPKQNTFLWENADLGNEWLGLADALSCVTKFMLAESTLLRNVETKKRNLHAIHYVNE